jgi:hypothetical protein
VKKKRRKEKKKKKIKEKDEFLKNFKILNNLELN